MERIPVETRPDGDAFRTPSKRTGVLVGLAVVLLVGAAAAGWWLWPAETGRGDTRPSAASESAIGEIDARAGALLESDRPEDLRQAIVDYREMLEHRPGSPEAYLGIAEAKLELSALSGHLDIELYADEAHALLDRVLAAQPDNARAWLRKAELHFLADWDVEAAEAAYLEAIRHGPDHPENYLPYTEFLLTLGEFERAEQVLTDLRRADPAWYRFVNMSFIHFMRGEYDEAAAESLRLANSEREVPGPRRMLQRIGIVIGDDELAAEYLFPLMEEAGLEESRIAGYREIYRQQGLSALFGRLLDDRVEANLGHYRPPVAWARYAVVAGRTDEALEWLERAVEERQPQVLLLDVDPHYLPIRHEERFGELLDRLPRRAGGRSAG